MIKVTAAAICLVIVLAATSCANTNVKSAGNDSTTSRTLNIGGFRNAERGFHFIHKLLSHIRSFFHFTTARMETLGGDMSLRAQEFDRVLAEMESMLAKMQERATEEV